MESMNLKNNELITKESLICKRDLSNAAYLEILQKYNKNDKKKYFVVEGKDDVSFYTTIVSKYRNLINTVIVRANSRRNVVNTYKKINWRKYSKKRIYFFYDRDLSEITKEESPKDKNIYVTDKYSIENSIFNSDLLINVLKTAYSLDQLEDYQINKILSIYNKAKESFYEIYFLVMAIIVYWRTNDYICNINNLNDHILYKIDNCNLLCIFDKDIDVEKYVYKQCCVEYQNVDYSRYKKLIENCGGIDNIIRGKYVLTFFVNMLNYIVDNLHEILECEISIDRHIQIGKSNAILQLSGYANIPESLYNFIIEIK